MNEPLLERIQQLEHRVRRWRRISVVLAFLLICAVAIGGIFLAVPPTEEPGRFWHWLPWVRAREAEQRAREAELQARQDAVRALDAERRAVEAAKEREQRGPDQDKP